MGSQQYCIMHDLGTYDKNLHRASEMCEQLNSAISALGITTRPGWQIALNQRVTKETIETLKLRVGIIP